LGAGPSDAVRVGTRSRTRALQRGGCCSSRRLPGR